MAQQQNPSNTRSPSDADPASARSQQELYGRPEPRDLDEGPGIGRDADALDEATAAEPRGEDASGRPSTARSGANTQ